LSIDLSPLSFACLKGGGYGGHGGFMHGKWMGKEWHNGYAVDLRDPEAFAALTHTDNTGVAAHCGDAVGCGVFELHIYRAYEPYGLK